MLVFLAICVAGALFFGVSLLFGGGHEADVHGDFGHVETDHGDADHGSDSHHEQQGPSIFSIRSFFLFMTGFGAMGAIGKYFEYNNFVSSLFGCAAGVVFAFIGWGIYKVIHSQQATTTLNTNQLIGQCATVTVAIAPGSVGQVVAKTPYGGNVYLTAKPEDEDRFREGDSVRIIAVVGDLVTVGK